MFENIDGIEPISDSDLALAMGTTKANADGGKKDTTPKDTKDAGAPASSSKKSSDKSDSTKGTSKPEVTDLDSDDFSSAFGGKKGKESDDDDDDQDDDDDNKNIGDGAGDDDDDKDTDDDNKDDQDDDNKDEPVTVSDFLKARVDLLINKGGWKPFEHEGKKPEEIEWTEELFEEIEIMQNANKEKAMRDQLLDSFGTYGRDIAEYAENGGDPDKLMDIFTAQQEIKAIDITTDDGKKEMVFYYQTEVLGKTADSAKRWIKSLEADKALDAEAEENKTLVQKSLDAQADNEKKAQAAIKRQIEDKKIENQQRFVKDITEEIGKLDDADENEKQQLIKALTKFKKVNGQDLNDLSIKFAEFRKTPKNYLAFARLVLNPQKYIKTIENKGKTKGTEKAFSLARNSQQGKAKGVTGGDKTTTPKRTGFRLS